MGVLKFKKDTWFKYKKCDENRVEAPKSVQDICEIKSIAENGIFEVGKGGIYTKTYMFSDINYATASIDEQIAMLENWCRWLNSNNEPFKITFNNKNRDIHKFKDDILFNHRLDVFDDLRDSFNEIIEDKMILGRQGIEQELYITVRCDSVRTYEDAKSHFNVLEVSMKRDFNSIGSRLRPLNASERLQILHDVYRFGKESEFKFDFSDFYEKGWDFKDAIVSSCIDFSVSDTYFKADDNYIAAVYIKSYPTELTDRYLTKLFSLNVKMIADIDVNPISREDVDIKLKKVYMGVQRSIRHQGKQRLKEHDFENEISYTTQLDLDDIKDMIDDVRNKGQHVFWTGVTLLVISDSIENLERDIELIKKTSRSDTVIIDNLYSQQREAFNTVLPTGVKQVDVGVPLETRSLAALFPFNVQELFVAGGNWYGINRVSKNLNMGNRKKLLNGNGIIFGVTGSGKSGAAKLDIFQTYLKTNDDIIVIDPKGDYAKIGEKCHAAIVEISAIAENYVNPLAYYGTGKERQNIADDKAEIVFAILEACKKEPLTSVEMSVTNRCLKYVFKNALLDIDEEEKTLTDLYNEFVNLSNDSEAGELDRNTAESLRLYLELFTQGSLNMFAKKSNVDINNRMVIYNLSKLGKAMWDFGILVMLEYITERVMKNYALGKATWIYIDEMHVLLNYDAAQKYLLELWKKVRSYGGMCTGITQNVGDLLKNDTTIAIVENSEFLMILKQNNVVFDKLVDIMGISPEQVKYITSDCGEGKGLLKHGEVIVPFDMSIPEDSDIFEIINTNPHENGKKSRVRG